MRDFSAMAHPAPMRVPGSYERLVRWMKRWSKTIRISGALLIAGGIISGIVQTDVGLKYTNLGSDPRWVPPARTDVDALILGIPARSLVLAGLVVLVAGCV